MNNWIDNSLKQYYNWLKDKTYVTEDKGTGWNVITTPFLGMFNDNIEIYVKMENSKILLSDDGVTLTNLELSGTTITRSLKRQEWMNMVLLNYGITLYGNELQANGDEKDFPQKKHNLLCAISEISDMSMMAKNTVSSLFKEDVKAFLDEREIIYTPQFIAKGSTVLDFNFDFQIAGKQRELVIKTFNSLNKLNVPSFLFGWEDIKQTREKASGKELMGVAIKEVKQEYLTALESKSAKTILWSKRHQPNMLDKLVA